MGCVFTIGHSRHSVEEFINLLNKYRVDCLIDVRTSPYSKFIPHFNRDHLKETLKKHRISYIFMGEELGARRKEANLYTSEGYLDFEKTKASPLFIEGIDRVKLGISKGYKIALLCSEKDPIDCHRSILIGKNLKDQEITVNNIKEDGSLQSQEQLEERLLDMYFPERFQQNIFDILDGEKSKEYLLKQAYIKRNRDVAYRTDSEEDL